MMIPEPMPPVTCPNGEKPSVDMPFAVIVTTDFCAWAMTAVRSRFWTVVALVVFALPTVELTMLATGASWVTANAVPPAARVALRIAAASTVPAPPRLRVPEPRSDEPPSDEPPCGVPVVLAEVVAAGGGVPHAGIAGVGCEGCGAAGGRGSVGATKMGRSGSAGRWGFV